MANLIEKALLKKGRDITLLRSRQSIQMWYDKHRLLMREGQPIEFIRRDSTKETFATLDDFASFVWIELNQQVIQAANSPAVNLTQFNITVNDIKEIIEKLPKRVGGYQ